MKKVVVVLVLLTIGFFPFMKAMGASRAELEQRIDSIEKQLKEIRTEVKQQKATWEKNVAFLKSIRLGGEIRTRWEMNDAFNFDRNDTDSFFLLRTRFSIEATPVDNLRIFIQAQDARIWGEERFFNRRKFVRREGTGLPAGGFGFDPTTEDDEQLDMKQAYFELSNVGGLPVTARIGRQELVYGDERLIGPFDWDNVGRSFDAIKLMLTPAEGVKVDFWYAKVLEELNDDRLEEDDDIDFWGLYASTDNFKDVGLNEFDLYALLLRDNGMDQLPKPAAIAGADALDPSNNMTLWTFGARVDGVAPILEALDYNAEVAFQFGTRGPATVHAWAVHGALGYTLPDMMMSPRFGIEYNFASGDGSPDNGGYNTFTNLFPTNHDKYGIIDFMAWRNMHDLSGNITVEPIDKLTAKVAYHYFALAEERDAWYGSPRPDLYLATDANFDGENEVGQEIDLTLNYMYNDYVELEGGYALFLHGDLIRQGASRRANALSTTTNESSWGYLQAKVHF